MTGGHAGDSDLASGPGSPERREAAALLRAFGYAGRPYDFDLHGAGLQAYEPADGFHGLAWTVTEILGRPVIPANEFAPQFDAAFGTPAP